MESRISDFKLQTLDQQTATKLGGLEAFSMENEGRKNEIFVGFLVLRESDEILDQRG